MENTTTALSKKHILNYGLLLGLVSVLFGVIIYITNSYTQQSWVISIAGFAILIASIVLGINGFKKENNNLLSLSQALKVGIGIAMIGGLIGAAWMYILMNYIEPDMVNQIVNAAEEQMIEQNPNMTEAQIETAIEITRKFTSPGINTAISLIGNLFFGFIISIFAGLIMKKES